MTTLFVFELQLLLVKPPLLLIIKLVVEALNVARAHILSVQLLDHTLGITSGLKDCIGGTVRPAISSHVDYHLNRISSFSEPISNLPLSGSIWQPSKVHRGASVPAGRASSVTVPIAAPVVVASIAASTPISSTSTVSTTSVSPSVA